MPGATGETADPFPFPVPDATGAALAPDATAPAVPRPKLCGEFATPCAAANADANPAPCPKNCAAEAAAGNAETPLELVPTIGFMRFVSANCAEVRSTSMHSRHHLRICPIEN
jgi:hypothetical protein